MFVVSLSRNYFYLYSFLTFLLLRRVGVLTYCPPSYTCPIKSFVFFLLCQYDTVHLYLYFLDLAEICLPVQHIFNFLLHTYAINHKNRSANEIT